MLGEALNQHPGILCFRELFHIHEKSIQFNRPGYRRLETNLDLLALRKSDPYRFLKQKIWSRHPKETRAVGFKMIFTQGRVAGDHWWTAPPYDRWWRESGPPPSWGDARHNLWEQLEQDSSLHVIHLKRKNTLKVLVSMEEARSTQAWGDGAAGGFRGKDAAPVTLSPEHCLEDFQAADRFNEELRQRFSHHPYLETTYEQLTGPEASQAWEQLQDFLNVSRSDLTPVTRALNQKPLQERVKNFEQLETFFRGTPYEGFFANDHPSSKPC